MLLTCPMCGSHVYVKWGDDFLCCTCNSDFVPKCENCGDAMSHNASLKTWVCDSCPWQLEDEEIELPEVPSDVYLNAFRNAKSKKNKLSTSGSSSKPFWKGLVEDIFAAISDGLNLKK